MSKDKDGPKLPPKPEKKLIPAAPKAPTIGDKQRAGRLLSSYLRRIAQEETEIRPGGDLISKSEALVRLMWKIALGYTEFDVKAGKDIIHKPSAGMIALIWDRIEGRSVPLASGDKDGRTLPKKISEESKNRLNRMVPGDDGSTD